MAYVSPWECCLFERHKAESCMPCLACLLVFTDDMIPLYSFEGSTVTKPNMPSLTKWPRTPQITR